MNHDSELRLQAYLDGELSAQEAATMEKLLATDSHGLALLAELRNTKMALAGNQVDVKLPESREFFWSKVQREIERQEKAAASARSVSWMSWVRHHLMSVGGAVALTCVVALMLVNGAGGGPLAEMEVTSDDMGAYTFRDQQEKMTVVWLYDKSDDSEFTEPAAIASMDPE